MGRRGRAERSALALIVVLTALLPNLLACGSGSVGTAAPAHRSTARSAPPEPPAPPAPAPVSVLTGLPADPNAPVLCVKIDNAPPARPPAGLDLADVVYMEPVEGGVSRLLAVFQSQVPPVVGPVRSARQSDLELLANFGHPALAFSGEAAALRPLIDQAPLLDVSAPVRPGGYHRDYRRPAPHNLFADTGKLTGGAPARDIGFRFGPTPPGGEPMPETTVRYSAASITLQWVPAEARWVVAMDGSPLVTTSGARPGAATVVLQRVAVHDTNIRDASGAPSPFAATVGTGDVVVLRDGQAFHGHWARPAPDAGTTYSLLDGSPLTFAPGRVWVVLVPG